jgi:CheY-like chemotaxis protein
MVRTLVIEVLEDMGHIVIGASDAASGLRVVMSSAPLNFMITDVGLPSGMNGRQLADAAREHRPDLKVLFITGYAVHAVLDTAQLEAGMHVVTKRFTLDAFVRRIGDLLPEGDFAGSDYKRSAALVN